MKYKFQKLFLAKLLNAWGGNLIVGPEFFIYESVSSSEVLMSGVSWQLNLIREVVLQRSSRKRFLFAFSCPPNTFVYNKTQF